MGLDKTKRTEHSDHRTRTLAAFASRRVPTHWGGWEHLNRTKRSPVETARLIRTAKEQVRFALTLKFANSWIVEATFCLSIPGVPMFGVLKI